MKQRRGWSKLHAGAHRHRKIYALSDALGCSLLEARGIVLGLWSWVTETEPDGDLSRWSSAALAAELGCPGRDILSALLSAGLVDPDSRVHGWEEHAGSWKEARRVAGLRARTSPDACTVHVQDSTAEAAYKYSTVQAPSPSPSSSCSGSDLPEGSAEGNQTTTGSQDPPGRLDATALLRAWDEICVPVGLPHAPLTLSSKLADGVRAAALPLERWRDVFVAVAESSWCLERRMTFQGLFTRTRRTEELVWVRALSGNYQDARPRAVTPRPKRPPLELGLLRLAAGDEGDGGGEEARALLGAVERGELDPTTIVEWPWQGAKR